MTVEPLLEVCGNRRSVPVISGDKMRSFGLVLASVLTLQGAALADDFRPQPQTRVDARLSPDGKRVALVSLAQGRQILYVHSLVEGGKDGKIVRPEDYSIRWVRWKDNGHLIAEIEKTDTRPYYDNRPGDYVVTRLISINADGDDVMMIGEPWGGFANPGASRVEFPKLHPQFEGDMISLMPQTPGRILQSVYDRMPVLGQEPDLSIYTVDVVTGDHELVEKGDSRIAAYLVDKNAVARLGIGHSDSDTVIYARSSGGESWREIRRIKKNEGETFTPLAFMPGNPRLAYVMSNRGPEGKAGLWSFDTVSGNFADLIDDQADISHAASVQDGVLLGYLRKDGSRVYSDPAWQTDYLSVKKTVNSPDVEVVDRTADGSRALVAVREPNKPKVWWVLDRTGKSVDLWPAAQE
jgi:hypothetical protein